MHTVRLDRTHTGSILDIGGGGEGIIGRLYGRQVTAIDNRREELDEAPEGFEKVLMDACEMSFASASFDHVTFFYTMMFIAKDKQRRGPCGGLPLPATRRHAGDLGRGLRESGALRHGTGSLCRRGSDRRLLRCVGGGGLPEPSPLSGDGWGLVLVRGGLRGGGGALLPALAEEYRISGRVSADPPASVRQTKESAPWARSFFANLTLDNSTDS